MSKFVIWMSFLSLVLLTAFSTLMPNSPLMWLADISSIYNLVRVATAFVLLILLITAPPRKKILRFAVGIMSFVLLSSVIVLTNDNKMQLLDSLALVGASISMGIVALEISPTVVETDIKVLRRAQWSAYNL